MSLFHIVKKFLDRRYLPGRPILLGFSGGCDSLALLHLLMEHRLDLHVAHVDHGWRPESGEQAEGLKKDVESLKLPFHLHKLDFCPTEEKAREGRLRFFSSLYDELGCQALILAHHGDDQSETVLKRVLEGASLLSLGGIQLVSIQGGMNIWRPLLKVSKQELRDWLQERGLTPIEDPTNHDLRSRMRQEIFPELGKKFGKEISVNLRRLGQTAQELKEYLDKKTSRYFEKVERKGDEVSIDLNPFYPFEKIELKAFLKKFADQEGFFLSHDAMETLFDLIERDAARRKIISRGRVLEIQRRNIAIKN